ncbi:MAG TPA: outer membrane beta-barrel protein [Terracidiphilus sp.]|nr:outer membrane beta-barrel protein [Terracidiphilus sp.]
MKRMQAAALLVGTALLLSGTSAHAQFDVAGSFFQTFNSSTTGNGTIQKPKNSAGGMIEFRYIQKPLLGFELSYSFNPADESYSASSTDCGLRCNNAPVTVTSNNHMVGVHWVLTTKGKYAGFRPFGLVGPGFVISEPNTNDYGVNSRVRISFDYGGGVDYAITPDFGVRAQIRGAMYKAPDLYVLYSPTGVSMQTLQPSVGIYFRL